MRRKLSSPLQAAAALGFRWHWSLTCLCLGIATLLAHGESLDDGLFFDDHWHARQVRESGWSMRDLLEITTLAPQEFMECWWQTQPVIWQYSRPVSVALLKLTYGLTHGKAVGPHVVSLLLHWINACLVFWLCLRLTRRSLWSLMGGFLFVVYSHSVFAVGWIASQNVVLQVTFSLAALLCYIRAARLDPAAAWSRSANRAAFAADASIPRVRHGWLAAAAMFWMLALLTRESAILLPAIFAAFDVAFGGKRHLWARRWFYVGLGVIAASFAAWRFGFFYEPMPDFYQRRYEGPGYFAWWLAKFAHYVVSSIWLSPMVIGPTGRFNPLLESPGDFLLTLAIIAIMSAGYWLACRNIAGWWIWPLWLLLAILPVVPIMATPHQGYAGGVAFAVAMILGPAFRRVAEPRGIGKWSPGVATWFLVATIVYVPIYRALWDSMRAGEKITYAALGPLRSGPQVQDVFFVNLPFVNTYAQVAMMENNWPRLRHHVLTYAPDVLRFEGNCKVEQTGPNSFLVEKLDEPYFSGAVGRYLIEGMRKHDLLKSGDEIAGAAFRTRVLGASASGVERIEFIFPRPLNDPSYRFFIVTADCSAAPLLFEGKPGSVPATAVASRVDVADRGKIVDDVEFARRELDGGTASAGLSLLETASANAEKRDEALRALRPVLERVSAALAAPVARDLLSQATGDARALSELTFWWRANVDDEVLRAGWVWRDRWASLRDRRDLLYNVRQIARRIIRTDLYLTGPPFPGPR